MASLVVMVMMLVPMFITKTESVVQQESLTQTTKPLHVGVFLIDDLGYGDTGYMGAEYSTPTIDNLAMNGIRLNQSYVMQLCSPTRASLLSSRYSYNVGMDGSVLISGDARCLNLSATTVGNQMQNNGVKTAFIGKYDIGYSSWACTANCRGFDYWLGYYGAAEDYYLHGGMNSLDFHENFVQAPQYRGEYSTTLFARKAIEWIQNQTNDGDNKRTSAVSAAPSTFLYFSSQAVHGPIEAPPGNFSAACAHINDRTRNTYCAMMQALDHAIANITNTYKQLGIFDDTLWLFLADNGGTNQDGGFNVPLRGQKATLWEGGIRSQTFLHWTGFSSQMKGSVFPGLAHATDWGLTLTAALGHQATAAPHEPPFDGFNLWPSLTNGGPSPRTEILISMRDADQCPSNFPNCQYPGQWAYRKGQYKLMYGHTALRGAQGDTCAWSGSELNCWNGWGRPKDLGPPKPPVKLPPRPGQPNNSSLYSWGGVFLFDVENDPLEEHDLSQAFPELVNEMLAPLIAYNASQISQDTQRENSNPETCGKGLSCAVPWRPSAPDNICKPLPGPTPAPPAPDNLPSHLTEAKHWEVSPTSLGVQGWACYVNTEPAPMITLQVDNNSPIHVLAVGDSVGVCRNGQLFGRFNATFNATNEVFTQGKHKVNGTVTRNGSTFVLLDSPGCINDARQINC